MIYQSVQDEEIKKEKERAQEKERMTTGQGELLMLCVSIAMYVATIVFAFTKAPLQAIITLIAGTAYMSMYLGFGLDSLTSSSLLSSFKDIKNEYKNKNLTDNEKPRLPRYCDWILTTPLLLFLILRPSLPLAQLVMYMALDAAMIYAGYASASSSAMDVRWIWFGLGCVFFLPILYALIRTESYYIAAIATLILWLVYPVLHVLRYLIPDKPIINEEIYSIMISVFDLLAKIGIGALVVYEGIRNMKKGSRK